MNRRRLLFVVAVIVLAGTYLLAGSVGLFPGDTPDSDVTTVEEDKLIQPAENGSYLWPYTSRSESPHERTLAINVLIHGDPDRTKNALTDSAALEWEPMDENEEDADPDSYNISVQDGVDWDDADGSTRYTYIDASPHGGEAQWLDESYQLHSGTYLGSRQHIRAYTSEADNWTAIQVHDEYFDWFRLRHTVTDIQEPARVIEDDFIDQPFVEDVSRTHYGLSGGWSDGWISNIELAIIGLLSTVFARDTRTTIARLGRDIGQWALTNRYGFVLAAALAGLLLGVRAVGIGLEAMVTGYSPQYIAGMLYPLLVVGPPVLVLLLAPRLRPLGAFGFTVVGLGTGFVYDFAAIGIGMIPIQLLLHRLGLVVALGLLAVAVVNSHNSGRFSQAGHADKPDPPLILLAGLGWLVGLALPLFGYL